MTIETVTPHPTSGDVPRVLKVKVLRDGGHIKVRVYIGQEGSPGYCGELVMRPDEFLEFRDVLQLGDASPGPKASIVYEGDVPEWLRRPGRDIVCSRCHKHTGNSNQGHYWAYCSATKSLRSFHMCCPGDCELEAVAP